MLRSLLLSCMWQSENPSLKESELRFLGTVKAIGQDRCKLIPLSYFEPASEMKLTSGFLARQISKVNDTRSNRLIVLQLGERAASLNVAELYVNAFANLAKTNNTVVLPANVGDAGSMVAQVS